jgi:hypothetical protein
MNRASLGIFLLLYGVGQPHGADPAWFNVRILH